MKTRRLDKTVLTAHNFEEAERANLYANDVSIEERLKLAFNLTCTIYGIKKGDSLKLDRTIFSARKFM